MKLNKLFKDAVRDIIRWADPVEVGVSAPRSDIVGSGIRNSTTNSEREINYTIINATGGKIVKVLWYDHNLNREYVNLHIVTDQEDLATELAQIITRENMQR